MRKEDERVRKGPDRLIEGIYQRENKMACHGRSVKNIAKDGKKVVKIKTRDKSTLR